MNLLSIPPNDKLAVIYPSASVLGSLPETTARNPFHDERREQLKLAKKQQTRLATALIHEVRNPLTNINLAIEMLEASLKGNDLKIYLDIIRRSSARINELVIDLFHYRIANRAAVEMHSIHQLLDEVLLLAEDRIALKKILVSKSYAGNDYKVNLNRKEVFIGLTNIVINAIDAMEIGNGNLRVTTKSIGRKYIVEIEDNGCGISKENLEKIATPYFTNKPGGLGIGLAATYSILKENHVAVNVESIEGCGTRFELSFGDNGQLNAFKSDKLN